MLDKTEEAKEIMIVCIKELIQRKLKNKNLKKMLLKENNFIESENYERKDNNNTF